MKTTEEKMNEWRKVLVSKEQRQKAAEEAKLLGTAMQQLLPEIFEDKRAIPNCFLRGALFGMVRKGRRFCRKVEIFFNPLINQHFSFAWRRLAARSAALCSHKINLFCYGQHSPIDFTKYTLLFT